MADFQFYLNRQGVRGAKGVKGDKGDSPIVSVNKHTTNEYVLQIDNPDGTQIITPNLVGQQIVVNKNLTNLQIIIQLAKYFRVNCLECIRLFHLKLKNAALAKIVWRDA